MKVNYIMSVISIPNIAKYGNKKIAPITERTFYVPLPTNQTILPGQTFEINPAIPRGNTLKCMLSINFIIKF